MLSAVASAAEPMHVVTFNIRYDGSAGRASTDDNAWISREGTSRRDLVLKVIDSLDPDLLGLQEALPNQVNDLRESLDDYEFYSVGRDDGRDAGEHCTLAVRRSRFTIADKGTFWLCPTPDKPGAKHPKAACVRIASWVKLIDRKADDRKLLVMNTHWDHVSDAARVDAARLIRERLAKLADEAPALVMGDLNAREQSGPIRTLTNPEAVARLIDTYRAVHPKQQKDEATFQGFSARTRGSRIDYVLATPEWKVLESKIVRTKFGEQMPSDHYPVATRLAWGEPPAKP